MKEHGLEHGELLIKSLNEHWIKYIGTMFVAFMLLGISLLMFVLAGVSAHHTMWLSHVSFIAAMLLFVFTLHWLFMTLLSESLDRIIITNRRLLRIQYRLLFSEDILEINFEKMKMVDARKQGILQNILHYGTLYFESTLASVPLVRHPNRIAKIIREVMASQ